MARLKLRDWEGRRVRLRSNMHTKGGTKFKKHEILWVHGYSPGPWGGFTLSTGKKWDLRRRWLRCVGRHKLELIDDPEKELLDTIIAFLEHNPWSEMAQISKGIDVPTNEFKGLLTRETNEFMPASESRFFTVRKRAIRIHKKKGKRGLVYAAVIPRRRFKTAYDLLMQD